MMEIQSEIMRTHSYSRRVLGIGLCLLILVSGGLYLNSLGNQFTNWDDGMIYGNLRIRSLDWENIVKIFTPRKGATYQPIRVLCYALDYHFWELDPRGYHISNIFFYVLTCLAVFFSLRTLSAHLRNEAPASSHERVAFFGSLVFAVHPVHVEAVTWLAARKEVLQGFFFFMAFYLYVKGREKGGRRRATFFGLVLLFIVLAILSKPSAIVFPAVVLVYEISAGKGRWIDFVKRYWMFFVVSLSISLLFLFISIKVMLESGGVKAFWGGTLLTNLIHSFYSFIYHIKLLTLTINYSTSYVIFVPGPVFGLNTFLVMGAVVLFFGLSLWSLRKTRIFFFSLFFFFVTLLPYLNIVPISTLLADRYVFIPSFSYAFLLGIGFDRLYAFKAKPFSSGFFKILSVAVLLLLLSGHSFMTIQRNKVWENSYTLWADAVEKYPESNTANALMGVVYMDLEMNEKAVEHLEKAVLLLPYDYESRNNLGIVYGRLDQPERALEELKTALQLRPDSYAARINLSVFYIRQKEYQKAEETLKYLLSKDPGNAMLYYRLGAVYKEMGDYGAAVSSFTRSMELAPHIINPYEELGNIYLHHFKDVQKAKDYFTRGIEAVPDAPSRVDTLRREIQDLESR